MLGRIVMNKVYTGSLAIFIIFSCFTFVRAQQAPDYNPLYGPPPQYQSLPVVKRLSYENFRNLKLLQAGIENYGGGEAEIQKLVDQYADASALYFQNKVTDAAVAFLKNEAEILETSKKLSTIYKKDSEQLLNGALKVNIKKSLREAMQGKKDDPLSDKFIQNAQFAVQKGNDYYDRYANAKQASPRELVNAIYYYRRAKENIFQMYEYRYLGDVSLAKDKVKVKNLHKKVDEDKSLSENEKKTIKDQYNLRSLEDIKNRPFRSMEKEN